MVLSLTKSAVVDCQRHFEFVLNYTSHWKLFLYGNIPSQTCMGIQNEYHGIVLLQLANFFESRFEDETSLHSLSITTTRQVHRIQPS